VSPARYELDVITKKTAFFIAIAAKTANVTIIDFQVHYKLYFFTAMVSIWDNIKLYLKQLGYEWWIGLIWLVIGVSCWSLCT
jgi:hypothetical protein